jgi:hypothetical protein
MIKSISVLLLNKMSAKNFTILGLLMFFGLNAHAACYVKNGFKAQVIEMKLGRVLITPSSQVGDTLITGQFPINAVNDVGSCPGGGYAIGTILQGGLLIYRTCGVQIFQVLVFVCTAMQAR